MPHPSPGPDGPSADPREPAARLLRDLRTSPAGLNATEAERRRHRYGPNELPARRRRAWPAALARQFTHPLALLLVAAALLALLSGSPQLGLAILAVVALNATFALVQEHQAGRAVETLGSYLPPHTRVRRAGAVVEVAARDLVPGDVVLVAEGDRVPADARLISGAVEIDASALTGESVSVERDAAAVDTAARKLDSPVLVFSGTACTGGAAEAVVHATGSHTEIGRIAALTGRPRRDDSPLEQQVRRVAYLIAAVAVGVGIAFLPLGRMAGLSWTEAAVFAVGLLVANVPEGLLPTITLALAGGVRAMARRGALVKRLSAVETLGSTTVICTDKTGTLTQGVMRVEEVRDARGVRSAEPVAAGPLTTALARCATADLGGRAGDATELALLELAATGGEDTEPGARERDREQLFAFDPRRRTMLTLDRTPDGRWLHLKGAPEVVLPRCGPADGAATAVDEMARRGLRVIAVARRAPSGPVRDRDEAEGGGPFELLGLLGLVDPPRPEVPSAVAACHSAGIRVHVVTGDHGATAVEIAREVGIAADRVIDGERLDRMTDAALAVELSADREIVFSRVAPEAKLRIADALHALGHVVAMTGDGVNDAPALHHADIGVAMGRGGTEVAREAATMILTDDDFATVVAGVEEGRRVFENVRKFVLYIFAHAVPEIVPFLLFALSGGLIPLPLTVLQILAVDLGTETVPALALGREKAEPGIMDRPPRPRGRGVVDRRMLLRAWVLMGTVSAVLGLGLFLLVLMHAGWSPGDPTGPGTGLHAAYLQATTASFAAIVACQIGTAMAARTDRTSLARIGIAGNRMLLVGIAFEIVFAAAIIYLPGVRNVFGMAPLPAWVIALLVPMPVLVWAVDELFRRWSARRRDADPGGRGHPHPPAPRGGSFDPDRVPTATRD